MSLNLDQLNFKFVSGVWMPVTLNNFKENLERFFNFCIEIYCRNTDLKTVYNAVQHLDNSITVTTTESSLATPDMIERDANGIILRVIEFKCSLFQIPFIRRKQITDKVKHTYGDSAEPVFLEVNLSFIDRCNTFGEKNLFRKMYQQIESFLPLLPDSTLLRLFPDNAILPTITEILSKHPKVQAIPDSELEHENYTEIPNIIRGYLSRIKEQEEFANLNFLQSEDMPNYIPHDNMGFNVSSDHPWNRDKNQHNNWGYKAQYLYHIPIPSLIEDCNIEEISSITSSFKLGGRNNLLKSINGNILVLAYCSKEIKEIKEWNEMLAILTTEADAATINTFIEKHHIKTDDIEYFIHNEIDKILMDIKTKLSGNYKISKHGNVVIEVDEVHYQDGLKANKGKIKRISLLEKVLSQNLNEEIPQTKGRKPEDLPQVKLEFTDYFTKPFLLDSFEPIKIDIPNTENAYDFNPNLNDISNELSGVASSTLEQIFSSKAFAAVYNYTQFYRAIVAASPRSNTKNLLMNEGVVTKHPMGYYIFVTPSPNEITSGMCVTFGKMKSKNSIFPEWCNKFEYITTGTDRYFMSYPFRVNLPVAINSTSYLGSFIGAHTHFLSYKINLLNDELFNSLWFSFARQLVLSTDYIYMFYKQAYNIGTFGKLEFSKKFKELCYRDVRVTTIMYRLYKNFGTFAHTLKENLKKGSITKTFDPVFGYYKTSDTSNDLRTFKQTIFTSETQRKIFLGDVYFRGVAHTSWQSFLGFDYLKQIFNKDDGFDPAKLLAETYRGEMEHQDWYNSSFFNSTNTDLRKSMSIDAFFSNLFKTKGKHDFWQELSYHPDSCYRMVELFFKEALLKDPTMNPSKYWNTPALKTGKMSKVMSCSNQSKIYGTDPKYDIPEADQRIKGIASSNLTENLLLETNTFRKHVDEKFLMGRDSPWFSDTGKYTYGDKMATMMELSLWELLIYPTAVIVSLAKKDQYGFAKRVFFIQTIFNRNQNKIWDESFRPLIEKIAEDMILKPGMEKYILFEKHMAELKNVVGHMMISKDATRFGDTYQIETFILIILAAFDVGYLTKDESKMLLVLAKALKQRIVIMPHDSAKLYEMMSKEEERILLTDQQQKWVFEMYKYVHYLNDPSRFEGLMDSPFFREVMTNPSFKKTVGFTLGVFNIKGSLYTDGYERLIKLIEEFVGLEDYFRGKAHSDDAVDITNGECTNPENFKPDNFIVTEFVTKILQYDVKLEVGDKGHYIKNPVTFEIEQVSKQQLSKLHNILVLFTPRLFSQRPSLTKTSFGLAAEVLQVVLFNNSTYVPIIRYATAIGKDLPGKSPASDLYMAIGRVYDIMVNMGSQKYAATVILAINWLMGDVYGLNQKSRKVNDPPEIGGLWWAIPSRVYVEGFNANEVRLQGSHDQVQKRLLALLVNTPDIWKKETKKDVEHDKLVLKWLELDEVEETLTGGIEYRKDLQIHLNRKKKTSLALFKMISAMTQLVDKEFDKVNHRKGLVLPQDVYSTEEKVKWLKAEWMMEVQAGSKSYIQNAINIMSKYHNVNFQQQLIRLSPDISLVSQMGFMNRKYPFPFSDEVKIIIEEALGSRTSDVISVEETWQYIRLLANSKFVIPNTNMMGIRLIHQIIGEFIWQERTIRLHHMSTYKQHLDLLPVKYKRVKNYYESVGVGTNSTKALVAIYEMEVYKLKHQAGHLPLRMTKVVLYNQDLADNNLFTTQVSIIRGMLNSLGFNANDIYHHFRLLSRLLSEKNFHGILKIPREDLMFTSSLGLFWDLEEQRIYHEDLDRTKETIELQEKFLNQEPVKDYELKIVKSITFGTLQVMTLLPRIFSALGWFQLIEQNNNQAKYDFKIRGSLIKVPIFKEYMQNYLTSSLGLDEENILMSAFLYYSTLNQSFTNQLKIIFKRNKVRTQSNHLVFLLSLKIEGFPTITCIEQEPSAELLQYRELKKTQHIDDKNIINTKWAVFLSENSQSVTSGVYAYKMSKFMTYFLVPRDRRIRNYSQLLTDDLNGEEHFAYFENTLVYKESGPKEWKWAAVYVYQGKMFQGLQPNKSIAVSFGFVIPSTQDEIEFQERENYLVAIWKLTRKPSQVQAYFKETDQLVLDDNGLAFTCLMPEYYLSYEKFEISTKVPVKEVVIGSYIFFGIQIDLITPILRKILVRFGIHEVLRNSISNKNYEISLNAFRTLEKYFKISFITILTAGALYLPNKQLSLQERTEQLLFRFFGIIPPNVLTEDNTLLHIGYLTLCYLEYKNIIGKDIIEQFRKENKIVEGKYEEHSAFNPLLFEDEVYELDNEFDRLESNISIIDNFNVGIPIEVFKILFSSREEFLTLLGILNTNSTNVINGRTMDLVYWYNALYATNNLQLTILDQYLNLI